MKRLALQLLLTSILLGCDKNSGQPGGSSKESGRSPSQELAGQGNPGRRPSKPTQKFRGSFGESFLHSGLLAIEQNPHGGANRVGFTYKGFPFGSLNIRNSPPKGSEEHFVESGIAFLRGRYGVDEVEHSVATNSNGNAYHRFTARIAGGKLNPFEGSDQADPAGYTTLMVVFFDERTTGTDAQKILREMYGTFQFEFVLPKSDIYVVSPEIETLIDTFELPKM